MSDAIDLCDDEEDRPVPSQGRDAVWILDGDDDKNEAPPGALECAQQQAPPAAAKQHTAEEQSTTEHYALDCGCRGRRATLVHKLHHTAECLQQAGFGQTVDSIGKALSSISCAQCSSLLSAQDTWKLLGPDASSKLYTALASSVRQVALAQQGQEAQQTDTAQAAAVAEVCCELWGELAALQSLMLGGDPTPSEAAPAAAAAAAADTPSRPARRGRSAQQQQAKQPAKPKPKAKKAPKYSYTGYGASSGSSGAWAAGTGYGGSGGGITKAAQAAMSAAAARQAAADTAMTAHLTAITAILQDPLGTSTAAAAAAADPAAAGPSSRKRGRSAAGLYSGLPWPLCGVVLAGPLAWLLRLLFHNDSLMDVVERQELYSAAMELLRHVGSSPDLLPLLQLPADDPRDASPPAHTTTAAGPSSTTTSLLATLRRLEQQASLYKRSAEQLMGMVGDGDSLADDEETTAAVCLALDLSSMVQSLEEGVDLWANTLGQQHSTLNIKPISAALDTQQPAQQQAAAAVGPAAARGKRKGRGAASTPPAQPQAAAATPPAAPSAEAAAAAAQAERYVSAMQPYAFIEADLLGSGHYFAKDAAANALKAAGGEVMRRRLKRITEELGALSTSLPLGWDSSILLAVHADRLDVLRACLLPHPDTPYGGGAFLFDILLPPEYPDQPPKVKFLTTGAGTWRANPNLYECGKVCVSLLGTWAGPSWEPGVSTLLQVLVSLQSMVFVPDPYFNEPGYERYATTAAGKAESAQYNAGVRLGTITHALLAQLRQPDPVFGEAIRLHYSHQAQRLTDLMQQWLRDTKHHKPQLQQVVSQVQQELTQLTPPTAEPQQQQQQQQGRAAAGRQGGGGAGSSRLQQVEILGDDEVVVVDLT